MSARIIEAGHRAGRRCLRDHLPRHRNRHRQGVHRRRAPVQCLHPVVACDRRHGRRKDRGVLRRSRKTACEALVAPRPTISVRCRSRMDFNGGRSAGRVSSCGWVKACCGACGFGRRFTKPLTLNLGRSYAQSSSSSSSSSVVVSLIGGLMRDVALIVPQLPVDAVGGEQLGMRAALDRLAA